MRKTFLDKLKKLLVIKQLTENILKTIECTKYSPQCTQCKYNVINIIKQYQAFYNFSNVSEANDHFTS